MINKFRILFINIFVFGALLTVLLVIAEISLKIFGKNIQIESTSPFFIHSFHRQKDIYIDNQGFFDLHGFRTPNKTNTESLIIDTYQWYNKNKNKCSIIILGDSSPFGDGRLPKETWPSKFSEKIDCKVFTFAKNGWSSLQMFEFYKKNLKDLDFSYLIVSVVHNDAQLLGSYDEFTYNEDAVIQKYFIDLFPNKIKSIYWRLKKRSEVIYIIDAFFNRILSKKSNTGSFNNLPIVTWGYSNWVKELWNNKDVQDIWRKILYKFYYNNSNKKILYFFAINNLNEDKDYKDLGYYLKNNNIDYLYCIDERFNMGQRKRSDWANLADAHPGSRQIEIFSNCLADHFKKKINEIKN